MEVLYANILTFFLRFFSFFSSYFKRQKLVYYLLEVTKYLLFVLVFSYVNAKAGMYFSLICMFTTLIKYFNKQKNIFFKLFVTIIICLTIYYFRLYNVLDILLFSTLIFKLWLKKLFSNRLLTLFSYIEIFIFMFYGYKFKLYMLIFYKALDLGFNMGLSLVKNINDFANKRIN